MVSIGLILSNIIIFNLILDRTKRVKFSQALMGSQETSGPTIPLNKQATHVIFVDWLEDSTDQRSTLLSPGQNDPMFLAGKTD